MDSRANDPTIRRRVWAAVNVNPQRWSQVRIAFNAADKEGVRLYGARGASARESCEIRDSKEDAQVGRSVERVATGYVERICPVPGC